MSIIKLLKIQWAAFQLWQRLESLEKVASEAQKQASAGTYLMELSVEVFSLYGMESETILQRYKAVRAVTDSWLKRD